MSARHASRDIDAEYLALLHSQTQGCCMALRELSEQVTLDRVRSWTPRGVSAHGDAKNAASRPEEPW